MLVVFRMERARERIMARVSGQIEGARPSILGDGPRPPETDGYEPADDPLGLFIAWSNAESNLLVARKLLIAIEKVARPGGREPKTKSTWGKGERRYAPSPYSGPAGYSDWEERPRRARLTPARWQEQEWTPSLPVQQGPAGRAARSCQTGGGCYRLG